MIKIRVMTESDISRVAQMEAQIFTDPWSEKVYRETFELEGVCYLVAINNDDETSETPLIIGAAGIRNIAGTGEITNVMITPEFRGRGIAKRMLTELLERGRELGATEFTLEVRVSNDEAVKLYEKLGFVREGIRPGFYRNPPEDAAIYWLREQNGTE